jgi:hypothetical protein
MDVNMAMVRMCTTDTTHYRARSMGPGYKKNAEVFVEVKVFLENFLKIFPRFPVFFYLGCT